MQLAIWQLLEKKPSLCGNISGDGLGSRSKSAPTSAALRVKRKVVLSQTLRPLRGPSFCRSYIQLISLDKTR